MTFACQYGIIRVYLSRGGKEMFNGERKLRFISEKIKNEARKESSMQTFLALSSFEDKYGKDVCEFSKEEVNESFGEILGFRASSKRSRLSIVKSYLEWCEKQGYVVTSKQFIDKDSFSNDKFRRQSVANPSHLHRYMNMIYEKESENTVDNTHRCMLWMAYAGIGESDAYNVSVDDVNMDELIIRVGNDEYPIYREAIPAFRACVNNTEFVYKHPKYAADVVVYRTRINGNRLIRGFSTTSITTLRVDLTKRQKVKKYASESDLNDPLMDLSISYYRVWLSGLFYRMYEAERSGIPVDFMPAAAEFMRGKEYKLDKSRNLISAKQRQVAKDYLRDYNIWKEVYSI